MDVLVPPFKEFIGGSVRFHGFIVFKKIDNKLIELFIVKAIIMA